MQIKNNIKLPDFLIVGAAKSATTSLYHYLIQNYRIFLPANKEPHYFSLIGKKEQYKKHPLSKYQVWDFKNYQDLFKTATKDQIIGEASTSYLFKYKTVISEIKKIYGKDYKKIKIIISLRNPVERAFSQYTYMVLRNLEKLEFREALTAQITPDRDTPVQGFRYLEYGLYFKQVKAYLDEFENVKVILFDDIKNDPKKVSSEIFEFLGLKSNDINTSVVANPSGKPKNKILHYIIKGNHPIKQLWTNIIPEKVRRKFHPLRDIIMKRNLKRQKLNNIDRKFLISYYKDDIIQLSQLINRDLKKWLEIPGEKK